MDFTELYENTFDCILETVKLRRLSSENFIEKYRPEQVSLFEIRDKNFFIYRQTNEWFLRKAYDELDLLFKEMLKRTDVVHAPKEYNATYNKNKELISVHEKDTAFFAVLIEDGKKIGYFLSDFDHRTPKLKDSGLDKIITVDTMLPNEKTRESQKFFNKKLEKFHEEYWLIEDFFNHFWGEQEYENFLEKVQKFLDEVQNVIGLNAVITPSEEAVGKFRSKIAQELQNEDFTTYLPSNLYPNQKKILKNNFYDRGLFKALLGHTLFADSFIRAEWEFRINQHAECLDMSGIASGYFKAVEQLIALLIQLHPGERITIKRKSYSDFVEFRTDNKSELDWTLHSLMGCLKNNISLFDVSAYVVNLLCNQLEDFRTRDKGRNNLSHSENLYDENELIYIRDQARFIFFLILGGFHIENNQFSDIGIENVSNVDQNELRDTFAYADFQKWIHSFFDKGISPMAQKLLFEINKSSINPNAWKLSISAISKTSDFINYWLLHKIQSSGHEFYQWQSQKSKEEVLITVAKQIYEWMKSNRIKEIFPQLESIGLYALFMREIIIINDDETIRELKSFGPGKEYMKNNISEYFPTYSRNITIDGEKEEYSDYIEIIYPFSKK